MKDFRFAAVICLFTVIADIGSTQNINTPENFPDPVFRQKVEEFMGVEAGGEFTAAEAAAKTGSLSVTMDDISNTTGLEYFTGLEEFSCYQCGLDTLDVSKNTALIVLGCGFNLLNRT